MALTVLFSTDSAAATVRQPVFQMSFGAGGGGGGLLGAAGIGGATDPWQGSVFFVSVEAGLAPFVDMAKIDLSTDEEAPEVALDDEGTISLGYNDSSAELVFTATVSDISYNVHGTKRLHGVDGGVLLSRLRINQSYEQQNAGEIVNDLVSQASVETDTIEDGVDFPFYVIDDRQNAYQHIAILARKSGYVAYFTTEGKLYFGPFADGEPVQTFSFGMDIMALQLNEATPVIGMVTAIGEGAAGSQGQEAWPWLVKDPSSVTSEAGDGEAQRLVSDPSLRSAEAVQTMAIGMAETAGMMAFTGRLVVPGSPAVIVGSTIEITDVPQDALNGVCFVRRVQHQFSKQGGFISVIDFSKSGEAGAGGGLGGLP